MGGRGSGGAGGGGARGGGGGGKALDRSQMTDAQKRAEIKAIDKMEFHDVNNVSTHRTGFDSYTGQSYRRNEVIVSSASTKNSRVTITQERSLGRTDYNASLYSGGKLIGITGGSTLSEAQSRSKTALKDSYAGYNL